MRRRHADNVEHPGAGHTAPDGAHVAVHSFDRFEADFSARVLRRDGEPVQLAPQTWRLLEFMVGQSGQVVSKREILTKLWPDQVASEYALSRTVRRLREALGDDARSPRFLRTIHGVGFQWLAAGRSHGLPTPRVAGIESFVGRTAQIELLAAAAASATRGRRQIVAIDGDLGTGKTTLAEEFIEHHATGWWIARGRCSETRSSPEPFGPILQAIDRLAECAPHTVVPALRKYAPTWLIQLPWLTGDEERFRLEAAVQLSSRGRMLRELTRLLEELTIANPVVMFLDDVHWADTSSVEALEVIAGRPERSRLLIIACYRSNEAVAADHPITDLLAKLTSRGAARRVQLDAFGRAELRSLIESTSVHASRAEIDDLSEGLQRWTGGNPLFASMALEQLRDSRSDGDLSAVSLDFGTIPSLGALVDQIIGCLDPADIELLETASLVGPAVSAVTLADITGRNAIEIEAALSEVASASPVLVPSTVDAPADVTALFTHAAFRERLMNRPGRLRREMLHRSIGESLERSTASHTVDARDIARHLELGGQPQRAVPYWLKVGRRSYRRFAYADAQDMYERAVSTLSAQEESDPLNEIPARLGLALAQLAGGTAFDTESQRNTEVLHRLVEPLHDTPDAFSIWQSTLLVHNLRGRADWVRAMAPAMLAMAEARERPGELMDAHHAMGEAALHAGQLATGHDHFVRAQQICTEIANDVSDPSEKLTLWLRDSGARIESALAGVAVLDGRFDEARAHIDEAIRRCTDGPNTPLVRVGNHTICAATSFLLGDVDRASELAEQAVGFAEGENADFTSIAEVVRWASGAPHRPTDVRRAIRTMLDFPTVPFPLGPVVFFRSELLPPGESLEFLDETIERCTAVDTHWADVELLHQRGRLLLLDGEGPEVAAPHLRAAVKAGKASRSPFFISSVRSTLASIDSSSSIR